MLVWDITTINDELDLLEFRLRYLDSVVDRFIVVEAPLTFSGLSKPLHLTENLQRFAPWRDKLSVVVADLDPVADTPWVREGQQRRAMYARAAEAAPADLVLSSDLDEIPYRQVVTRLRTQLQRPTYLQMQHQLFYANWLLDRSWVHGFAVRGRDLARTVEALDRSEPVIRDVAPGAGNHYSFLGGAEAVERKIKAYSHQEFNTGRDNDPWHLRRCLQHGVHFSGGRVLEVQPPALWDEQQHELAAQRPDWFEASIDVSRGAARAFAAWVWLRRRTRMPSGLVSFADAHPRLLTGPLRPLLLVGFRLLERGRAGRQR